MNLDETRNGILKTIENKGGNAPMKILHGYSKLIHQVAHREFSEVVKSKMFCKMSQAITVSPPAPVFC